MSIQSSQWVDARDVDYLLVVDCCGLLEHLADDANYRRIELNASDVVLYETSLVGASHTA